MGGSGSDHGSWPCIPSSALKYSRLPTTASSRGCEPSAPATMSCTSAVPCGVPSLDHSSRPVAGAYARRSPRRGATASRPHRAAARARARAGWRRSAPRRRAGSCAGPLAGSRRRRKSRSSRRANKPCTASRASSAGTPFGAQVDVDRPPVGPEQLVEQGLPAAWASRAWPGSRSSVSSETQPRPPLSPHSAPKRNKHSRKTARGARRRRAPAAGRQRWPRPADTLQSRRGRVVRTSTHFEG